MPKHFFRPYIDPKELERVKQNLKRGQTAAFKHAVGEAVLYWRDEYAPRHFTDSAHRLYGHRRSKYGHEQAKSSQSGDTINQGGYTLTPPFTIKEVIQTANGHKPQNLPIVFSGQTREGILHGQFTVRGTSKKVRGSWNSQKINWRGLSARGKELGQKLVTINPKEQRQLVNKVENEFLPKWIKRKERGQSIPGRLRMTSRNGNFTMG